MVDTLNYQSLLAYEQAYIKSNSSCRRHCKSSLLAPELSLIISEITQPVHGTQGMTPCDLKFKDTYASKVSRGAGKDLCNIIIIIIIFPNRCFILNESLKK